MIGRGRAVAREIIMPEQTGEKAEVKMYSDFKSPYALSLIHI